MTTTTRTTTITIVSMVADDTDVPITALHAVLTEPLAFTWNWGIVPTRQEA